MKTLALALGVSLAALVGCSHGGDDNHAPLLGDIGNGGTNADASAGFANGDGGSGQGGDGAGGLGQNAGGTAASSGGTENGGAAGFGGASGGAGSGGAGNGTGSGGAGGASTGTPDGGAAPACVLSSGIAGCDSCVQRHCNAPCVTCENNSECNAILECILTNCFTQEGVVNQQCAGNCDSSHPNGKTDFDNLVVNPSACARTYCESFCSFF